MRRTSSRPLATRSVSPRAALIFGLALGIISVGLFAAAANLLAAALTLAAILDYVVIYTMLLKRHTSQSTLWGGICGAAPGADRLGRAAGSLSSAALLLFAVVFFWQPPHFWALAIKYRDDYAAAGIPMLPVVAPLRRVLAESVVYSWLMVIASRRRLAYCHGARLRCCRPGGRGGAFLSEVHRLHLRVRHGEEPNTMRLFHWSVMYLTLLFAALAVDSLIR